MSTTTHATDRQSRQAAAASVDERVTALLTASRALVGVSARSLAEVEDTVTLTQFRTLVVLDTHGPINLNRLADRLAVNASTAMRMIDRLLAAGLVTRRDAPANRRQVILGLTPAGGTRRPAGHRAPAHGDHPASSPPCPQISAASCSRRFALSLPPPASENLGPHTRPRWAGELTTDLEEVHGGPTGARHPGPEEGKPKMIQKRVSVERFAFTCHRCGHAWMVDYGVEHVEDGHGHAHDYFLRYGLPAVNPTSPRAVACPGCGCDLVDARPVERHVRA